MFNQELGVDFTLELMRDIHKFIIKVFRQRSLSARRPVKVINVYITEFPGYAHTKDNNINISASALDNMYRPRENSRWMFTSLMFQEMAHVFQWNGESTAPQGLVEGIADYVMVKSGFYVKRRYTMPGAGQRWDEGFGVTERFLENCDVLLPGFTAKLNNKMRYRYTDEFFANLLGKPVNQLWKEYKELYGNQTEGESIAVFQGLVY